MRNLPTGPKWAAPVIGLVVSSAVAGLATAPIGAAHFNAVAHYGLLANLTSVPLMGALVIPAAVLALLLAPFGAEAFGLWIMGGGLAWILWVAETVSSLDGARGFVSGPGPWAPCQLFCGKGVRDLAALQSSALLLLSGRLVIARWS
jgi:competence protein ComEC